MNELIREDNNNWEEIIPEYAMIPAEEGPKLRAEASSDSGTAAPAAIKAPEPAQKPDAAAAAAAPGPGAVPVEAEAAPVTYEAPTHKAVETGSAPPEGRWG